MFSSQAGIRAPSGLSSVRRNHAYVDQSPDGHGGQNSSNCWSNHTTCAALCGTLGCDTNPSLTYPCHISFAVRSKNEVFFQSTVMSFTGNVRNHHENGSRNPTLKRMVCVFEPN